MALNTNPCLCLLNAGVMGMYHHLKFLQSLKFEMEMNFYLSLLLLIIKL